MLYHFHPDSTFIKCTYIAPLCHKLKMANKEIHFKTRSEMPNFSYFTDKETPSNYDVLQDATKSATFTDKSILMLEQ
jgi:hypothetical protein